MSDQSISVPPAFGAKVREFTDRAAVVAGALVDRLHEGVDLDYGPLRGLHAETGDVEHHLDMLADHVNLPHVRSTGALPCVEVDGVAVPIASQHLLRRKSGRAAIRTKSAPLSQALEGVGHHLARFLSIRVAWDFFHPAQRPSLGMDPTKTMLAIKVHSHTSGGRVSYSPAYFINYIHLAAPTSPVHGRIQPGRYVFMVTTIGPKSVYDSQPFDIPPSFDVHLVV